jgi:hypothetical protein
MMEVACGSCARMATLLSGRRVAMHKRCKSICAPWGSKAIYSHLDQIRLHYGHFRLSCIP